MKRYGLRIGNIGIEFPSRDERQKALLTFTTGTCSEICDEGVRFKEGKDTFSTYERDDKEVLANCYICKGVFGVETCGCRTYPHKNTWSKEYSTEEHHICDACLASEIAAKKLFDAQALVTMTTAI
jgi:hypothetical protein